MSREDFQFQIERDGLSRRLGGGIPKGSLSIIAGPYGAGKSVFVERLLYGFLINGHSVTCISTEMTVSGFIEQMKSLDYPVADRIINKSLMFIPVFPIIGKAKTERKDFLSRLIRTTALFDREIIVVDTFSSLIRDELNEANAIETISFFKKMNSRGKSVILTLDPTEIKEGLLTPFKSSADIFMEIRLRVIEGELNRTLTVNRYLKAKDYVSSMMSFRVEPNIGIIVDITTVA
jgi:flagellar protein FlaH